MLYCILSDDTKLRRNFDMRKKKMKKIIGLTFIINYPQ